MTTHTTRKSWSNEELTILKENYESMGATELAELFGRSKTSVTQKHYELVHNVGERKKAERANKVERVEVEGRTLTKIKTLADYEPRELMVELKKRGYVGYLTYTETIVHKIDLEKI